MLRFDGMLSWSHTVAGYVLAMLNFQDHVSVTISVVSPLLP